MCYWYRYLNLLCGFSTVLRISTRWNNGYWQRDWKRSDYCDKIQTKVSCADPTNNLLWKVILAPSITLLDSCSHLVPADSSSSENPSCSITSKTETVIGSGARPNLASRGINPGNNYQLAHILEHHRKQRKELKRMSENLTAFLCGADHGVFPKAVSLPKMIFSPIHILHFLHFLSSPHPKILKLSGSTNPIPNKPCKPFIFIWFIHHL